MTILEVARLAAPDGRVARHLHVTLLAVGTLVLGILFMHSVASHYSEGAHPTAHASPANVQSEDTTTIAAGPAVEFQPTHGPLGCDGLCDDTHAGVILCILALLTAVILLRYASERWRIPHRSHFRLLPRYGHTPARLRPILEALSISRT